MENFSGFVSNEVNYHHRHYTETKAKLSRLNEMWGIYKKDSSASPEYLELGGKLLRYKILLEIWKKVEHAIDTSSSSLMLGGIGITNELEHLPDGFWEYCAENISFLDFASNKLKTIPPEIGLLNNLNRLDLHSNQINSIPKELSCLSNLEYLNLSDNQLITIPNIFNNFFKLQYLYLSSNPINFSFP